MTKPTQQQIARQAQVSQTTVSMVLGNRPNAAFSTECRAKVLRACRELGYLPPRRRTQTLGLLLSPVLPPRDYLGSAFYARFYHGLVQAAGLAGYNLMLLEAEGAELPEAVRQHRLDGLILQGQIAPARLNELRRELPLVMLNYHLPGAGVTTLMPDNAGGLTLAVRRLCELGHRRIAFFGLGPIEAEGLHQRERFAGYRAALAEAGLECPAELIIFTRPQAPDYSDAESLVDEVVERFRRLDRPPTAVLSYGDVHLLRFMNRARRLDWRIPEQLSVIGFDNTEACRFSQPRLSSIEQPLEEMAADAIAELMALLNERRRPARSLRYALRLVERDSVAPPPGRDLP